MIVRDPLPLQRALETNVAQRFVRSHLHRDVHMLVETEVTAIDDTTQGVAPPLANGAVIEAVPSSGR